MRSAEGGWCIFIRFIPLRPRVDPDCVPWSPIAVILQHIPPAIATPACAATRPLRRRGHMRPVQSRRFAPLPPRPPDIDLRSPLRSKRVPHTCAPDGMAPPPEVARKPRWQPRFGVRWMGEGWGAPGRGPITTACHKDRRSPIHPIHPFPTVRKALVPFSRTLKSHPACVRLSGRVENRKGSVHSSMHPPPCRRRRSPSCTWRMGEPGRGGC